MARRQVSAYHATRANRRRLRFFRLPMIECCTCGGLNAAYDIIVRDDTQGGILIFFNFFFGRRNGGGLDIPPIYGPYWYNDARVYQSVYQLSSKSLSIFFLSGKFYTIPHPTYIPRAASFYSTKILRYAIHAQYNCRGRECHTSGLICSWNLILWGLEARRARSLYLGEWLWG